MMTMTERDQSCEARIAAHRDSREADFAALFAIAAGDKIECPTCEGTGDDTTGEAEDLLCAACGGDGEIVPECDGEHLDENEAHDRLSEYPLGYSVKRVMRVELSTGGPGDWLEIWIDEDGDVDRVAYHFNDWFDHAEREVETDSALWRAAEYYAEYVGSVDQ